MTGDGPALRFAWRGAFGNDELAALHAGAFGQPPSGDDWWGRLNRHSLGWATARTAAGELAGDEPEPGVEAVRVAPGGGAEDHRRGPGGLTLTR